MPKKKCPKCNQQYDGFDPAQCPECFHKSIGMTQPWTPEIGEKAKQDQLASMRSEKKNVKKTE